MSRYILRLTLLLLPLVALPAAALPEDRDQPIEIRADKVEIDDEAGTAVYEGSVQLDQGSLRVLAHTLTLHTVDQVVDRVVAEGEPDGEPARYSQIPEHGAAPIRARARTIVYMAQEQRVDLEGDAELRQIDDRFAGERISYDIRDRRITATGRDGAPVTMTIQPGRRNDGGRPDTPEVDDSRPD